MAPATTPKQTQPYPPFDGRSPSDARREEDEVEVPGEERVASATGRCARAIADASSRALRIAGEAGEAPAFAIERERDAFAVAGGIANVVRETTLQRGPRWRRTVPISCTSSRSSTIDRRRVEAQLGANRRLRASISAKPSRLSPRHRAGIRASGSDAFIPIPQISSWGLASTRTRSPVLRRNAPRAAFCPNLATLPTTSRACARLDRSHRCDCGAAHRAASSIEGARCHTPAGRPPNATRHVAHRPITPKGDVRPHATGAVMHDRPPRASPPPAPENPHGFQADVARSLRRRPPQGARSRTERQSIRGNRATTPRRPRRCRCIRGECPRARARLGAQRRHHTATSCRMGDRPSARDMRRLPRSPSPIHQAAEAEPPQDLDDQPNSRRRRASSGWSRSHTQPKPNET